MKKPFFARFLENQLSQEEENNVKGAISIPRPKVTMKAPSDDDENVTMKYPSDDDEGIDVELM